MIASLKDAEFDPVLRSLARALLWTLAGFGAAALMLIAILAWSGILSWYNTSPAGRRMHESACRRE